ncbi:hypothetical protein VTO42DRAFT_5883 [Malbranchea cinnamomea]
MHDHGLWTLTRSNCHTQPPPIARWYPYLRINTSAARRGHVLRARGVSGCNQSQSTSTLAEHCIDAARALSLLLSLGVRLNVRMKVGVWCVCVWDKSSRLLLPQVTFDQNEEVSLGSKPLWPGHGWIDCYPILGLYSYRTKSSRRPDVVPFGINPQSSSMGRQVHKVLILYSVLPTTYIHSTTKLLNTSSILLTYPTSSSPINRPHTSAWE